MLEGAHVAVVVPAFDEARLIARTLASIPRFVDRVVVVDDASRDRTAQIVAGWEDPRVELVRHAVNRGVGAAIATGYRRAFEGGADVAAVMAGDAQMDPADLRRVVAPIVRGEADYVKGDRLSHPAARARMPVARWVGNHALSRLTRLTTGLSIRDSQCGYTALGREAARRLPLDRLYPRYGYPNDLLSLAAVARLRVAEVVVRPVYGEERSGIRPTDLVTRFSPVLARSLLRRLRGALAAPDEARGGTALARLGASARADAAHRAPATLDDRSDAGGGDAPAAALPRAERSARRGPPSRPDARRREEGARDSSRHGARGRIEAPARQERRLGSTSADEGARRGARRRLRARLAGSGAAG
jgi:hypothetical protein